MIDLSVIIPVRHSNSHDIVKILENRFIEIECQTLDFIVIDDGSEMEKATEIRNFCNKKNIQYKYLNTAHLKWNASRARNEGVKLAKFPTLMFEDIDIWNENKFYEEAFKIYNHLKLQNYTFLVFPVIYLSKQASECINQNNYKNYIIDAHNNAESVKFLARTSSSLILSKDAFNEINGYDEEFEGWGFEDYYFWVKLLTKSKFKKPSNFFVTHTENFALNQHYEGWKALFYFHAIPATVLGHYSFHLFHENQSNKTSNKTNNAQIFEKKMLYLSKEKLHEGAIQINKTQFFIENFKADKPTIKSSKNKLDKLIKTPKLFFRDFILKRLS